MKENYFIFKQSKMMKYVQMNRELKDSVEWDKILSLGERERISFIQVVDDNENTVVIAFQGLQWQDQNNELQLQKLEVKEAFQKSGIGTTILKMVIAIGYFYRATKITGVVAGEPFLWDWYPKLGFTIHDENKLLMELRRSS
jgi:N-acetylglutamate synthase-like GNAT family acetyltransferase